MIATLRQIVVRANLLEAMRYGVVVVMGLCVDISVGFMVHRLAGLSLVISAAIGFVCGFALNYALLELWVFRSGQMTWFRLGKAFLAAQGALIARLGSVWLLGRLLGATRGGDLITLCVAAGVSFVFNYALAVLFLKPRRGPEPAARGME